MYTDQGIAKPSHNPENKNIKYSKVAWIMAFLTSYGLEEHEVHKGWGAERDMKLGLNSSKDVFSQASCLK